MNKTIKGSLAAGAAAVLLLGGAGSLAYWTDAADIDGGTITAGTLTLDAGTCGDWTYAAGAAGAGPPAKPFRPRDTLPNTSPLTV